ncbi:mechanosensitive ion channel [Desulfoglaeba alkanexedens ALDC]|uniref:Mechanosensitive ion channel n=1 Tax=Desulfoglaeba alkanexedens ALDC TaxID=980445 RepID=A0A4P8L6F7_9BACT|nr:mechanosensitive ion channel [Desulfoglaeba alkanexedens ALDC]
MELGLRESITTISAYVVWALGILASLNALGFSSTSLAVAFGALGIGLGFGLQNIFNNFISGLILLFERPIQVGDALEINGTWGEVVKINVRSTVVQTWDNASLIIPNSEFVTTQVTNWSFKDTRLRRSIDVGVAYASDVERVRETLLEAARSHPLVLHYPEPSVLFLDFGDSALLFRLRVWTTVKDCLTVETDLRFEITRLFRERGIEIPFPQHDLHLRSVADGIGAFKEKA